MGSFNTQLHQFSLTERLKYVPNADILYEHTQKHFAMLKASYKQRHLQPFTSTSMTGFEQQ